MFGRKKNAIHCSECGQTGHNKQTCGQTAPTTNTGPAHQHKNVSVPNSSATPPTTAGDSTEVAHEILEAQTTELASRLALSYISNMERATEHVRKETSLHEFWSTTINSGKNFKKLKENLSQRYPGDTPDFAAKRLFSVMSPYLSKGTYLDSAGIIGEKVLPENVHVFKESKTAPYTSAVYTEMVPCHKCHVTHMMVFNWSDYVKLGEARKNRDREKILKVIDKKFGDDTKNFILNGNSCSPSCDN